MQPLRCQFCDTKLPVHGRAGRPRRYCSQPCAQAAYRRRKAGIKVTPVDDKGKPIMGKPGGRHLLIDRLAERMFELSIERNGWNVTEAPSEYREDLLREYRRLLKGGREPVRVLDFAR